MDKEDRNKLINTEQLIGRALDKGVDLGLNPHKTINKYIDMGMIPKLINGLHPVTAVDRMIVIDQLLKDGKTLDDIKEIIKKERKAFLEQAGDLPHLVNLYKKASFKGLLMLGSLAILMIFSYSLLTSQPPSTFASELAKQAAKPVGKTLAVIIKQAKDEGDSSTDPLGLTNISKVIQVNEKQEIVIEKNIIGPVQEIAATNFNADKVDNADAGTDAGDVLLLDGLGNIDILGEVIAVSFTGSGEGLNSLPASEVTGALANANIPSGVSANKILGSLINADIGWASVTGKPSLLTSIDGVSNNLGNVNFIAGSGITITPNDTNDTITFSATGGGGNADTLDTLDSLQFLRSDTSDSFTSGTLTIGGGTTLSILGAFSCTNCVGDAAVIPGLTLDATASINAAGVSSGTLGNAGVTLAFASFGSITGSLGDANVADTITVSNYLPLAGGTMSGNINLNNNLVTNIGAAGTDFTAGGGLNIATDLDVNGHVALGGGVTIDTSSIVRIQETASGESIYNGLEIYARSSYNVFGPPTVRGIMSSGVYQGTITNANVIGVEAFGFYQATSGTPSVSTLIGIEAYWSTVGATVGSVSNAYGILASGPQASTMDPASSYGIRINNYGNAGTTDSYGLYIDDQSGSTNNYEVFIAGTAPVFALENSASNSTLTLTNPGAGNANLIIEGTCTSQGSDCAVDIAEIYNSSEPTEAGDLLVIDTKSNKKVMLSKHEYDQALVGVVTSNPAIVFEEGNVVLGANSGDKRDPSRPFVALAGRVPVKVSAENGAIAPGDTLTSSSNPGVAMKATKSGPVVGKALESYRGSGVGKIMVFINVGWYVAPVETQENSGTNIDTQTLSLNSIETQVLLVGSAEISMNESGYLAIDSNVEIAGDLLVAGKIAAEEISLGDKSSGSDTLEAGSKNLKIKTNIVGDKSKILATFHSDYSPATRYWVTKDPGEGFTLYLDEAVSDTTEFSWLIVN